MAQRLHITKAEFKALLKNELSRWEFKTDAEKDYVKTRLTDWYGIHKHSLRPSNYSGYRPSGDYPALSWWTTTMSNAEMMKELCSRFITNTFGNRERRAAE